LNEPARSDSAPRPLDVRVGSATNALQPVAGAARELGVGPAQWLEMLVIAGAAVLADQITKHLVAGGLALREAVEIVGPFSIHHVRNTGIAFGLFADATTVVAILTALAIGGMFWFFARAGRRHPLLPVSLGLVLGGSVSNLVDRVRLGYVTDFIDFDYWPAFNLADTFIVTGVALLFVSLVSADRTSPSVGRPPLSRS
jgi:signal peptidase II